MADLCSLIAQTSLNEQSSSSTDKTSTELSKGRLQVERIALFTIVWGRRNQQKCRDVQALAMLLLPSSQTKVPGYRTPRFPISFRDNLRPIILNYGEMTLVHLLLAAHRANPTIISPKLELPFEIVTQRGNLNKMALNQEKWRIGVQKIGNTLFLRRYLDRKSANLADFGYQFERACTNYVHQHVRNADYHSHLLASKIQLGQFRVLLESEIDAVEESTQNLPLKNQKIVELKTTKRRENLRKNRKKIWLQSYLGDVDQIKVGIYGENQNFNHNANFHSNRNQNFNPNPNFNSNRNQNFNPNSNFTSNRNQNFTPNSNFNSNRNQIFNPNSNSNFKQVNRVDDLQIDDLINESEKRALINRLMGALQFLWQNAQEGKVYLYYYTKYGNQFEETGETEKFVDNSMLRKIVDINQAKKTEE